MINFKNIHFSIGGVPLLENASGFVPTGHKVGIVGRNGVGKTTFFEMLKGGGHSLGGYWAASGAVGRPSWDHRGS